MHGACQEHAGFQPYHLYVFLFGHIITMLKVHVILLSLSYLESRFGEDTEDLCEFICGALCHALICHHEHGIAAEYGSVGIPFLVHCGVSSAHVGIVHEVVVQQGIVMVCLKCTCLHEYALGVFLIKIVGKQHHHWTYALASH